MPELHKKHVGPGLAPSEAEGWAEHAGSWGDLHLRRERDMGIWSDSFPLQNWLACWLTLVGRTADKNRTPVVVQPSSPALAGCECARPCGDDVGPLWASLQNSLYLRAFYNCERGCRAGWSVGKEWVRGFSTICLSVLRPFMVHHDKRKGFCWLGATRQCRVSNSGLTMSSC